MHRALSQNQRILGGESMTALTIIGGTLLAAATYIFRVRPWMDERAVAREMAVPHNNEGVTSPA